MKIMWLNESLVLRGETSEEKRALNIVYGQIGNDPLETSGILESGDSVDILEVSSGAHN